MIAETASRGRWRALLALGAILLVALALRYQGVDWPRLHPDEPTIAGWARWMQDHTYISSRFYASGFFHLVGPVIWCHDRFLDLAAEWREFKAGGNADPLESTPMICLLRTINAWMATLTVAVFYLLARRITGSRWAGLAAAAFLAVSRLHVEHAHYAETDIAMLFMLSVALYLWGRVQDGGRLGWFVAAAFATGWAIGTKFTLTVLLANVAAGAGVAVRAGGRGFCSRRLALLLALGVALCLGAVVWTNRGMTNLAWFIPHVSGGAASVYAERSGLLNKVAGDPLAPLISNWHTFRDGLRATGWGWGLLAAAGLLLSCRQVYRRFWPVTILFPAFYAVYFFLVAPWVRSQEFMAFFPAIAVWIAIGVCEAAAAARRTPVPAVGTALVALAVLAAIGASWIPARRMASLFGTPDPRIRATLWLWTHAPMDGRVGFEKYTTPVERLFSQAVDVEQVERTTPRDLASLKLDYLIRNVPSTGRGSEDPYTGKLYPEYAENLRQFKEHARLLCQWGALADSPYTFVGPRIEWWEIPPVPPSSEIAIPVFRPVSLRKERVVTVPSAGCDLGSVRGLWVDQTSRRFVVSGPGSDHRTLYVVLQTAERPATVLLSGLGFGREAVLGPYDVAAVPMHRPWGWPRTVEYDMIDVRARPRPHVEDIPCYAQIAFSPEEAALLLFQKGYADRALALLKGATAQATWLTYLCAVDQGDWPLADRLRSEAQGLLKQLEQVRGVAPGQIAINGHSGTALRDHRRVRLPPAQYDNDASLLIVADTTLNLRQTEEASRVYQACLPIPVRLAKGRYRVRFVLEEPRRTALEVPWQLTVGQSGGTAWQSVVLQSGARTSVTYRLAVEAEQDIEMTIASPTQGGPLEVSDIEVQWGDGDLLHSERLALSRALIRHALHAGEREAAAALIETVRQAGDADLEVDRLELDLATAEGSATHAATVAQRILLAAPEYVPALQVLAASNEAIGKRYGALQVTSTETPEFYPWVRLVHLGAPAANGSRPCVFEVLRDGTPPLKVRAWRRKGGHNREFFAKSLSTRPLYRGERIRMEIPPVPETGTYAGAWMTVESDPEWMQAALPVVGRDQNRIPLE